jgi:hypothetical protein
MTRVFRITHISRQYSSLVCVSILDPSTFQNIQVNPQSSSSAGLHLNLTCWSRWAASSWSRRMRSGMRSCW